MSALHQLGLLASSGWTPGSAPHGTPDPTVTPNPSTLVTGGDVAGMIRRVVTGSAGAMILVAAGVSALSKGWELALAAIRQRRHPHQPMLPGF